MDTIYFSGTNVFVIVLGSIYALCFSGMMMIFCFIPSVANRNKETLAVSFATTISISITCSAIAFFQALQIISTVLSQSSQSVDFSVVMMGVSLLFDYGIGFLNIYLLFSIAYRCVETSFEYGAVRQVTFKSARTTFSLFVFYAVVIGFVGLLGVVFFYFVIPDEGSMGLINAGNVLQRIWDFSFITLSFIAFAAISTFTSLSAISYRKTMERLSEQQNQSPSTGVVWSARRIALLYSLGGVVWMYTLVQFGYSMAVWLYPVVRFMTASFWLMFFQIDTLLLLLALSFVFCMLHPRVNQVESSALRFSAA